jgi:hypothetical protein
MAASSSNESTAACFGRRMGRTYGESRLSASETFTNARAV